LAKLAGITTAHRRQRAIGELLDQEVNRAIAEIAQLIGGQAERVTGQVHHGENLHRAPRVCSQSRPDPNVADMHG